MKTLKIIIFSLLWFLFLTNVFAQEIQEKEKKVDSLFTLIKNITPSNKNEITTGKILINDSALEKAKKMLYEAYAYAPLKFHSKLLQWHQDWAKTGIKGVKAPSGIKPSVRLKLLKNALEEKYGKDFVRFLETPYFLKVKILNITFSSYKLQNRNIKIPEIVLKAKVIEAVKGGKFYANNDVIKISYLPIWFSESKVPKFEINGVYAISLKNRVKTRSYNNFIPKNYLMIKQNGNQTYFKIENGTVVNPFASELHQEKSWNVFKHDFKQKYLIEKLGGK